MFVKFADGLTREKIAECLITKAEKTSSKPERRRQYQSAREELLKVLISWQDEESSPEKFGLSEEIIKATQKKLAECEENATS